LHNGIHNSDELATLEPPSEEWKTDEVVDDYPKQTKSKQTQLESMIHTYKSLSLTPPRGSGVKSGRDLGDTTCHFLHQTLSHNIGGETQRRKRGQEKFGVLTLNLTHKRASLVFETKRNESLGALA